MRHDTLIELPLKLDDCLLFWAYFPICRNGLGISRQHLVVRSHAVHFVDKTEKQLTKVPEEELDALLDHLRYQIWLLIEDALHVCFFLGLHLEDILVEYPYDLGLDCQHVDLLDTRVIHL